MCSLQLAPDVSKLNGMPRLRCLASFTALGLLAACAAGTGRPAALQRAAAAAPSAAAAAGAAVASVPAASVPAASVPVASVPVVAAPSTTSLPARPASTSPAPTQTVATAAASSAPNCGGQVMAKPGGGDWQCSFDDEFNGTTLNAANWVVQQTATSGYTTGAGSGIACYVDSANNVSVAGGYLNLTVRKEAKPFTCTDPFGNVTTQYTSGMVSSYGLFNQAYGLFEVSAKLPAATVKGLQETLWLWPQNDTKYGRWPGSGEIDFGEFYSQYPTLDIPYIHYNAAATDPNVTSYNCTVANESQFNTYGVQWSSSSLTILYNGKTCLVDHSDPAAPLVAPEPFDQPFFVALTQALGINTNAFQPGTTPLPATTQVDWVRVWK